MSGDGGPGIDGLIAHLAIMGEVRGGEGCPVMSMIEQAH